MGVDYIDVEGIDWRVPDDGWKGKVREGEPNVQFKAFTTPAGAVPHGQLVFFEPNHHEAAHSHAESELFYILEGEVTIGDGVARAGTLVHIEGGTVYGPLRGGAHGVKFLRLQLNA
jgi:mannose-6-phosphate isomerase-like protein (cupin superfamily)